MRSIDRPPPPGPGEAQLQVRFVGINHIDVFGLRGMAFARRVYPLSVGAEAACEVVMTGEGVTISQTGGTYDFANASTNTVNPATSVTAALPATAIAADGTAKVTAANPTPGGGTSTAVDFAISVPTPVVTSPKYPFRSKSCGTCALASSIRSVVKRATR